MLAAVLLVAAARASFWLAASLWEKVGRLSAVCAAGAAAYFGALWLLGFRLADFNRRDVSRGRRRGDRRRFLARLVGPAPALRYGQRGFVQSAYR